MRLQAHGPMIIASIYDSGRWTVAVLAEGHVGLVDLARLSRRLRRRLDPRTIYVVDGRQWIAEVEAVRLVAGLQRQDEAQVLAELAEAMAHARGQAVASIEKEARALVTMASAALQDSQRFIERVKAIDAAHQAAHQATEQPEAEPEDRLWN